MLHYQDEFSTESLSVNRLCIGGFGVNTYVLVCKATGEGAVIDPGGEVPAILDVVKRIPAHISHMIFTHAHIDHIYGAEPLKASLPDAKVAFHPNEDIVVENIPEMCRMFNVPQGKMPPRDIDLSAQPEFSIGRLQIRTIATPGHTPGGVCFYLPEHKMCFTGDTLFKGSVGRTDFEGGNGLDLRRSLDTLLEILPDDTQLLPGHGKYTTMGSEKRTNMYLRIDKFR